MYIYSNIRTRIAQSAEHRCTQRCLQMYVVLVNIVYVYIHTHNKYCATSQETIHATSVRHVTHTRMHIQIDTQT